MGKCYELSEVLLNAFGVESMIEYVCSLSNEQILEIISGE